MDKEVLATADAVASRASDIILAAAAGAIRQRGMFKLVLAGGSTPRACYQLLAKARADWSRWHIYFGDERCLEAGDLQRNSQMAAASFTGRVAIPSKQVHPIPAELGAEAAAMAYERTVCDALPFDLVILGLGEDGHTASLFPGHQHRSEALVVPVHGAPKPPAQRVSLGVPALRRCHQQLVIVTGAGKYPAMSRWMAGEDLPVTRVTEGANTLLLADRAATA